MKTSFIFPGQGSQNVGMGKALAETFAVAREVFQEVDDALGQKLSQIIFEGPEEALTLTENTQPAIMATSMAALRVLEKEAGLRVADHAAFVAGHSLGEYAALCAAGTLSLADTARLLKIRGTAMQAAVAAGLGAMAAILGPELEAVEAIVKEAAQGEVCSVANDNSPGQVVVSGHKAAVGRAIEIAKAKGAKRALLLAVSAPFHCPLMQPAADAMRDALGKTDMRGPSVPLVANITASSTFDVSAIRDLLVQQVTGRVRWRESVHYLKAQGVERVVEIGNGKVLTGLNKRIEPDMAVVNIATPEDVEAFAKTP